MIRYPDSSSFPHRLEILPAESFQLAVPTGVLQMKRVILLNVTLPFWGSLYPCWGNKGPVFFFSQIQNRSEGPSRFRSLQELEEAFTANGNCCCCFLSFPSTDSILKINSSLMNLLHIRPFFPGNLNKKGWYPNWSEKNVLQLDFALGLSTAPMEKGTPSPVVGGMQVTPGTR